MQNASRFCGLFLFLGSIVSLGVISSPAQISDAGRFAAIQHTIQYGADRGVYFVPETGFGFSIFRFLDNNEIEICTFTSTSTEDLSSLQPNQVNVHFHDDHSLAEYKKVDGDFNTLEYRSGEGKIRAELPEIPVVDAFLFSTELFYFVDRNGPGQKVDGKGQVSLEGNNHKRHLKCGWKAEADGSNFRFWFELGGHDD